MADGGAVHPEITRPDAGTVLVSQWILASPPQAGPAADLLLDAAERGERPGALLSLNALLSLDGGHLLYYAQWTDDEAHRAWARAHRPAVVERVDARLEGVERPGLVRYAPPVTVVPGGGGTGAPGLIVAVSFETEGQDAQAALVKTVTERLGAQPVPGLRAAHFHSSKDGRRVLNYAEWDSEGTWRAFTAGALSAEMAGLIGGLAGVRPRGAAPYTLYRSLVNVAPPRRSPGSGGAG